MLQCTHCDDCNPAHIGGRTCVWREVWCVWRESGVCGGRVVCVEVWRETVDVCIMKVMCVMVTIN